MKKPKKLIHIGLAKSMSTTLQMLWRNSDNYVEKNLKGITDKTDSFFNEYRNDIDGLVAQLEGTPLPFGFEANDKLQVLSGEGLASSWLCQSPELSEHIPKRQKLLATMFGPLADKILIIIRNPIDWIRSAYSQSLKEGGSLGPDEYISDFRVSIEKNLDLRALVAYWEQFEAEVVILPMELFKENEESFWIAYERMLKMSRPESSRSQKVVANPSFYETLEIHQSINKILSILETACVENEEYPVVDGVIEGLKSAREWGSRSAMERLKSDQILELTELLSRTKESGRLELPTELTEHLQKNFIDYLGETASFAFGQILEKYQQSVISSYRKPKY
ncbi:MAG: hypothetical protein CMD66_07365 [Gammaproteobacteria bacterium]|nr:hypothetical protein [Gammaproteobacteria bacterium]|tara:strand:- start:463 stop:1470 length:1008 start_codon:yes stop_codon:yes gene_type:complete